MSSRTNWPDDRVQAMGINYRDMGGRQNFFRKPLAIQYVTVTRDPKQIDQVRYFAQQYGIPTIEVLKDGVVEDLQVRQEHLILARKMAGLP